MHVIVLGVARIKNTLTFIIYPYIIYNHIYEPGLFESLVL